MVSLGSLPSGLTCSNTLPANVPAGGLTLNFVAAPTIAAGSYVITIQGSAGTATAQSNFNLSVAGSAGISLSMAATTGYAGQGANLNVVTSAPANYKGPLWLTFSNLPAGITVPGQPLPMVPGAQQIGLTFESSTVPGNYNVTGTLTAGSQSANGTSGAVTVLAATGIQSSANNIDIIPGGTATVNFFCKNNLGTNCTLQATVSGLPAGLTVSPAPPWQLTSQGLGVVFTAASNLAVGVYPVTITSTTGGSLTLNFHVNNANFTLVGLGQTQLTVRQGASASIPFQLILNVLAGGVANFEVDMSVSGLPQGTTAFFSPSHVTPGNSTTLTISASSNAPVAYGQGLLITATPTNSVLPQSLQIPMDLVPAVGQLPLSRSDFIDINGSQLTGVFDPVHNQVFVSNSDYNRVDVVSLASRSLVASIPVPQPVFLTRSVDGTQVVVGTQTSQVVWIDTSRLLITKTYRVPSRTSNPPSTPPFAQYVHELSNGTLLVMPSFMIVNPTNNQVTIPTVPIIGFVDKYAVNDLGTKIVLASNGTTVVYDVATATNVSSTQAGSPLAIDSTGNHIFTAGAHEFDMFDGALNLLGSINLSQSIVLSPSAVFSPDNKTAYLTVSVGAAPPLPTIYTVDVYSLSITGLASTSGGLPFGADQTGLLIGTTRFGVTVDDANFLIPAPASVSIAGLQLVPSVGPVGQQTQTQLGNGGLFLLPDVRFGVQAATAETIQTTAPFTATATAPASNVPGPVDVKLVWPNGTEGFMPLGFTYGPSIQAMLTDASTPDGGSSGSLFALGVPSDPSLVQLTIGGVPATVTLAGPASISSPPAYPFPVSKVSFTTPPGSGGAADVVLTTSNGSTTLKDGFHYATSAQDFAAPVSGTTYRALLYNSKRNELYLSGGDHVDIFSTSSSAFVHSITSSALTGKLLGGMAVSPDGNTLYITDTSDGLLLVANLSSLSSSLVSIPVATATQANGCLVGPLSVAVTSDSKAYVAYGTISLNHCSNLGNSAYYRVDLQTSIVTTPSFLSSNCEGNFAASSDGTKLAMTPIGGTGFFCIYDVNGGQIHKLDSTSPGFNLGASATGGTISADGTRVAFEGGPVVATSAGNVVNFSHTPDAYAIPNFPLTNVKLTDNGSLVYVLYPKNLDIFDANHGTLRRRITFTETAQSALDSLAIDPSGQHAYAITDTGLLVITLDAVPLSASEMQPASGSPGTSVTVHGNGFTNQTTGTLNGTSVPLIFTDDNTLTLTIPASASGMQTLNLANADGQTYTLGAAFSVN